MNFLYEFKSFYSEGDVVLIRYWYGEIITPVKIIEKVGRRFKVSHNVPQSEIFNAPDEFITSKDIIDKLKRI